MYRENWVRFLIKAQNVKYKNEECVLAEIMCILILFLIKGLTEPRGQHLSSLMLSCLMEV